MALTAYTINCREADLKFLHEILFAEAIGLREVSLPELVQADPPADLVFVGWEDLELEERPNVTTKELVGFMLTKIRVALAFRDVPVFVLVGRTHEKEAQVMLKLGANRILAAPLERQETLSAVRGELGFAGTRSTVDARVVNPFAEGALKVLGSMAKTKAERENVFLKRDYRLFGEISALIDITGERADGSVALTFERDLAWIIVGRMLGTKPAKLTAADVHDGIGELANMISGFAETALANNNIIDLRQSVPRIVTGHGHELGHRPGSPSLVIVFRAESYRFAVQVALHHEENNGALNWQTDSASLPGGEQ